MSPLPALVALVSGSLAGYLAVRLIAFGGWSYRVASSAVVLLLGLLSAGCMAAIFAERWPTLLGFLAATGAAYCTFLSRQDRLLDR